MPSVDDAPLATEPAAGHLARRGLTRREGLVALALLAPAGLLAACSGAEEPTPGSTTASAPTADLAGEVAAEESTLIATYDAVLAATGLGDDARARLALIRDQHAQHLEALGGTAGPATSSETSSPLTTDAAVANLIAAEREASRSRIRACVSADDAELARLLTFIAASEASHVPALRDLRSAGA